MSRQLVRPEEGPATICVATGERPLSSVDPLVSLEVGALLVPLMTVWKVTLEPSALLLSPPTTLGSGTAGWGEAQTQHLLLPSLLPLQQRHLHYSPGAHQFQTSLSPLSIRWSFL